MDASSRESSVLENDSMPNSCSLPVKAGGIVLVKKTENETVGETNWSKCRTYLESTLQDVVYQSTNLLIGTFVSEHQKLS